MKKLLALLITLCLLLTTIPLQVFAMEFDDDADWVEKMADDYFTEENFLKLLKAHDDEVGYEYLQQMNLLKQQNSISFFKGFSTVLNLGMGVYNLLMNIGVIENPQVKQFNNILEMLSEVKRIVNEIDKKADSIEKILSTEFSKIDYEFNQLKYDSYQKAWTDFFTVGAYKDMNDIISAYNSQINTTLLKYAKGWQTGNESGIRALYNGDFETLVFSGDNMDGVGEEIPSRPRWSDDEDSFRINSSVTLPGKYIKIEKITLNADNYQEFLRNAVTAGVISSANDGKLEASDSFYTEWNELTDEIKAEKAEVIAGQLMDSLHYEVIHSVANSTKSGRGTFASEFKAKYDMFCNTLYGSKSVTSPITAAFNKLTATHAFEGEIAGDLIAYSALLGTLAVQYGTYATMITALDDSMSSTKKKDTEYNKKISYNYVLYRLDNALSGYNNYCYPLKGLVEFHDVVLVSEAEFRNTGHDNSSFTSTLPWTLIDSSEYDINKSIDSKKEAADKMKNMLSLRDVSVLYYYYQQNGSKDFLSYLNKNNAIGTEIAEDASHNTTVITSDYEVKDLKLDKSTKLPFHTFGFAYQNDYRDKYNKEGATLELYEGKSPNECFVHDQVVGSVFNIASGSSGATSTSDVAGRTAVNANLVKRSAYFLFSALLGNTGAQGYGVNAVQTDGKFTRTTNINGYNPDSIGTESAGEFKNAVYTVSVSKDFGAITVKPLPEKNEVGKRTASVFADGNISLICGGAVLAIAFGFGCGFMVSKKKSKGNEA